MNSSKCQLLNSFNQLNSNHDKENYINNNSLDKSNGKTICSICKQDTPVTSTLLCLEYSNILKHLSSISKKEQKEQLNNYNNVFISTKSQSSLIQSCKCSKFVHPVCLLNYCTLKITLKCEQCNLMYNWEDSQNGRFCDFFRIFSVFFWFFLFVVSICLFGVCFNNSFSFLKKYVFWNQILQSFFFIIALSSFLNFLKKISKITLKKIQIFFKNTKNFVLNQKVASNFIFYLKQEHKLTKKSEILLKKFQNQIYIDTIINDYRRLNQYVHENIFRVQTKQTINADNIIEINSLKHSKLLISPVLNSESRFLNRQKSFENQNKPPIYKLTKKSKTKGEKDKNKEKTLVLSENKRLFSVRLNNIQESIHEYVETAQQSKKGTIIENKLKLNSDVVTETLENLIRDDDDIEVIHDVPNDIEKALKKNRKFD